MIREIVIYGDPILRTKGRKVTEVNDDVRQLVADMLETVNVGEEAILVGSQGEETIVASELAAKAGTITWEIFTGITKRVERVYR